MNRPADEAFVREKLDKTGGTVYVTERIDVKLAGDCHLPARMINEMRREAIKELDKRRLEKGRSSVQLPEDIKHRRAF